MNNPDYFISTSVTGDKGQAFLDILTDSQRKLIEDILPAQKAAMTEIAQLRTEISTELRKAMRTTSCSPAFRKRSGRSCGCCWSGSAGTCNETTRRAAGSFTRISIAYY